MQNAYNNSTDDEFYKNFENDMRETYGGNSAGINDSNEWSEPVPFDKIKPAPPFPVDNLPTVLKDFVISGSAMTQAGTEMFVPCILGTLSTALQGKFSIMHPSGNGHFEPLQLYLLMCAPPASRKSAVLSLCTKPLTDFEIKYNETHKAEIQSYNTLLAHKLKQRERLLGKDVNPDELKAIDADILELKKNPKKSKKLIVGDITPEELIMQMSDNDETASLIAGEGSVIDVICGSYSERTNISIFLSAYDRENYRYSRRNSLPVILFAPCLTICVAVQPALYNSFKQNSTASGRGLVQRFLISHAQDKSGLRSFRSEPIPQDIQKAYSDLFENLLLIPKPTNLTNTPILKCDRSAQFVFEDYFNHIQQEEKTGGKLCNVREWAEKHFSRALRISALLHIADYASDRTQSISDIVENPHKHLITGETAMHGVKIAKWFEDELLLDSGFENIEYEKARYISERLQGWKSDTITTHELYRQCQRITTADDFTEPLVILEELGYLKRVADSERRRGRPKTVYHLNPKWKR